MNETGCTHGWDWRKYGSCPMCADASQARTDAVIPLIDEILENEWRHLIKPFLHKRLSLYVKEIEVLRKQESGR